MAKLYVNSFTARTARVGKDVVREVCCDRPSCTGPSEGHEEGTGRKNPTRGGRQSIVNSMMCSKIGRLVLKYRVGPPVSLVFISSMEAPCIAKMVPSPLLREWKEKNCLFVVV